MKGTLLLVDDEPSISQLVKSVLKDAGYKVHHVEDSNAAFVILQEQAIDLIMLDIQLPGISGLRLLDIIRKDARTAAIPVIMLSVLGGETNKVRGLGAGADDYLVKPFSAKELLARVDALLRRAHRGAPASEVLLAGGIAVDLGRQEVTVHGKRIKMRKVEFNLLALLIKRKGFVLTYGILSDGLSQGDNPMTSGNLYVQVKNLRRKLGPAGKFIETVHGMGYKFVEPS